MRKFTIHQDKENIPVSAIKCPCPATRKCVPQCVRKPTGKGNALQELSTNTRKPPSSSQQYSTSSSITGSKLGTLTCYQSDFNSLAKREMMNILHEEKKRLSVPAEYNRTKPRSAGDVTHGTKFRYDFVESTTQNNCNSRNPLKKSDGSYEGRTCSTSTETHRGFASSGLLEDSSRNVSRRTSSTPKPTHRLSIDSGYSASWNSNSTKTSLSRLDKFHEASSTKVYVDSVGQKSWYSLSSTKESSSRLDGFSEIKNTHSRIPINFLTDPETLISERPQSQRNTKLPKRAFSNKGISRHPGEDEYAQDTLFNVLMIEEKITLPVGFMQYFGPDQKSRATIVNWMLGIQVQIQITDAELYLAVNLLDQVLARTSVPTNMLQLVALGTIWITNKYIGPDTLRASDLLWYANNAYVVRQLLRMERNVLRILNFQLHYIEPASCVDTFLSILGLENLELARFTAHYFLDCMTLLPDFSSIPVSILAAAVINVAIKMYYPTLENIVRLYLGRNMSSIHDQKRRVAESKIHAQTTLMRDENYMFRKAYHKNKAVGKIK
ncbi:unnamed protein product [Phaedon cochleariae]|uniref:Cyclin-like domain-containing protein n=1 Tax=Phaedon cochleariae TaxID=80249 RepID=A0A9P0GS48_PHACE|nr:unnamed protein product [Phaedon cochleariae]